MAINPDGILAAIRSGDTLTPIAVTNYFNALPAVPLEKLIGSWRGTCVQTGHPGYKQLVDLNWDGKTFHSINNVDPIIVREHQPDGSVKRVANGIMGKARIREVKYNGVVSAAMIYNERPIIDYFRGVDERTIIGVMDALGSTADHGLFFLLERVEEAQGKL
ncbi:hypothetical protein BJX68DRAFT_268212 [Aspergillus pseudodeflectus]|uniref:DUF4334 domain-containing protein n=1 Tax=Aspergillus pseudodeflectus TaxID=176178 RepID=A0ABR4K4U7_9EURO